MLLFLLYGTTPHQSVDIAVKPINTSLHITIIPTMDAVQAVVTVGDSDKKEVICNLSLCRLMAFLGGY
jgi:hypothetical protein